TTDNNTITFSTLDNGTHSNCTIKVTDSSANVSNTLEITDFTVSYSSGWQLIARQVDSDNFTVDPDELFDLNARTTFLQNENDNSSSTFMSIGNLTPSNYVTDGKYKFKLEWDGLTAASLDNKSVTWTQTSWLDNSTITGFEEISNSGFSTTDTNVVNSLQRFTGLGKSGSSQCVIDGNGGTSNWWNCVGVVSLYSYGGSTGMPGPLLKIASSMHLYIWEPDNYALDFDGSNDYVAADGVTSNLDSSTGLPFTVSAWAYPDTTNNEAIWAFNKTGNNDENLNLLFYGSGGNTKKFYHYGRTSYVGESTNTFEPGQWHHIVVVVDSSGNGKMFVNG
ncbi:uncharacterized protein METZ01_LOCUS335701, partial [marine metagenome]